MTKIRADLFSSGLAQKLGTNAVLLYAYLLELDQEGRLRGATLSSEESGGLIGMEQGDVLEGLGRLEDSGCIRGLSFEYSDISRFQCEIARAARKTRARERTKHVTVRLPESLVDELREEGVKSGSDLSWALRRRLSAKGVIQ